jgi:NAD(P)-dependent dehydrogenase (short-subunit alcohol dehydrogenase family)
MEGTHDQRRVTIVTGASQGIGRELARAFAAEGDVVVLGARDAANLEATAELVRAAGGEPMVVPTDVTDPASVDALVATVVRTHGRLDVLVANSGIGGPSAPLWEIDPSEWDTTFAVNTRGVFLCARAALPAMIETRGGCVVVVGSISGKRPLWGRSPYTASKLALVGLVRTLALEAGPFGVRVNLISPGFVEGPRIDWVIRMQAEGRGIPEAEVRAEFERQSPLGRLTRPEDVARAAVFLASPAASAITGDDLNVNAGVVMY